MSDIGVDFKSLREAIDWSVSQLDFTRSKRVGNIQQYVGVHTFSGGSEKPNPTNFIELAITIYMQQLAAQAPRCTFTTEVQRLKPFAYTTEIELNKIPEEIKLDRTFRRAVLEALFSYGIIKTGMCSSGISILGHDIGEMFADLVPIDDYFCDMAAKNRDVIQFEGNDYWIPVEDARKMYGSSIEPDKYTLTGDQGQQRAESVSTEEGASLYKEMSHLRDVWIPRSNKILTYGVVSLEQHNVIDWDGPDGGPYHMLGYSEVPGALLPMPPVSLWRDLHDLANLLFRKLGKSADARKTVGLVNGGNDDDVNAFINAKDGEMIRYNGQRPESLSVGGVDAPTLAFYQVTKDLASYFGGNWDILGGLGRASDTIGQDQMMQNSASARLEYMRDRTLECAKSVYKSLAWYRWTDPVRESEVRKPIKGTNISVRSIWSAETRDGDWLDYNFDLDAYSMQSDVPAVKLQKMIQYYERIIVPSMPFIQQQGGSVDFKVMNELASRLSNMPEFTEILTFGEPPKGIPEQGNANPAGMPANTTRTNIRKSVASGATESGKSDVMSRLLMGGKVQPREGSMLGKPTS